MFKQIAICFAILVSVVGCGGDAATKAENESLRARLEKLEANQSSSSTNSEQPRAQPETDTGNSTLAGNTPTQPESARSPEDVVRGYFAARRWQDRLPFVAYPDKVEARMRQHYAAVDLTSGRRPSIYPAREQGSGKWHVPLSLDGEQYGVLVVVKTKDGNKVDWEASQMLYDLEVEKARLDQIYGHIKDEKLRNTIKQWTAKTQAFPPGTYPPGSIPSGLYVYVPNSKNNYYSEEDLNGNIIDNEGFESFGYVHVHGIGNVETKGFLVQHAAVQQSEYKAGKRVFEVSRGITDYNSSGYYLVGKDIPAGLFRLTSINNAYYAIETGPIGKTKTVRNDLFSGSVLIPLSQGQYFKLQGATFEKQ